MYQKARRIPDLRDLPLQPQCRQYTLAALKAPAKKALTSPHAHTTRLAGQDSLHGSRRTGTRSTGGRGSRKTIRSARPRSSPPPRPPTAAAGAPGTGARRSPGGSAAQPAPTAPPAAPRPDDQARQQQERPVPRQALDQGAAGTAAAVHPECRRGNREGGQGGSNEGGGFSWWFRLASDRDRLRHHRSSGSSRQGGAPRLNRRRPQRRHSA